ncbi:MAG: peptidase C39 family protein, partial [Pseudomonadaceae bacterium]|nr:peptidase C39 family protein [Pseudomonadaceae bacterium]
GLQAKALQLPEAEARLQQNMLTQVNSHGLLVYPLQPSLQALLEQVAAGLPVLLRFNEGMAWVDMPRYAVLVGYDRAEQTLLLRAGNSRRWQTSFASFESAWQSSGAWAVLVLAPVQLPAKVDAQRWLLAADEVARAGHKEAAANARRALQRGASRP